MGLDKYDRERLRDGTLVKLHEDKPALAEQCPHTTARGRYVIASSEGWLIVDPGTKMQLLIWVNGDQKRQNRVHWMCFECSEIMPLASYEMS